ncbi:hypothetical protein ACFFHQ_09890, partial [Geobacillus jurassicus]
MGQAELVQMMAELLDQKLHPVHVRLDRIEGNVRALQEGQARLEGEVQALKEGQARLEGEVQALKEGQARL